MEKNKNNAKTTIEFKRTLESTENMTAKEIIAKRKELDINISRYRAILKKENVVPLKYERNYNLPYIYECMEKMMYERATVKIYQQFLNLGIKNVSPEMIKNCNFYNVFLLSELQELNTYLSLEKFPTINYAALTKSKKKKEEKEFISFKKLKSLKKALSLQISTVMKKIEDFNSTATLTLDNAKFNILAA